MDIRCAAALLARFQAGTVGELVIGAKALEALISGHAAMSFLQGLNELIFGGEGGDDFGERFEAEQVVPEDGTSVADGVIEVVDGFRYLTAVVADADVPTDIHSK